MIRLGYASTAITLALVFYSIGTGVRSFRASFHKLILIVWLISFVSGAIFGVAF